jgi:Protein of unknown function (DUF3429)
MDPDHVRPPGRPTPVAAGLPPGMHALGLGGLLPFIAGAAATVLAPDAAFAATARGALVAYGATILAFLGAVHWGLVLAGRGPAPAARHLVLAVLPALVGAGAVLMPVDRGLAVLIIGLAAWAFHEQRVVGPAVLGEAYLGLRRSLTAVAIGCLVLALIAPR